MQYVLYLSPHPSSTHRAININPDVTHSTFTFSRARTVEYRNLSPSAEREVFQRVQLGMSLTNAEKLQAISSPWANYITILEKTHLTIDGGLIDKISFDDSRGRAFQNVAQLVYCCAGLPAAQRIPTAAKLEKWLTSEDESPSAAFQRSMAVVLGRLWEIACSEKLDAPFRRFKAKVAPVEFVYIGTPLPTLTQFPPPILKELFYSAGSYRRCAVVHTGPLHRSRTIPRHIHPPTRYPQIPRRRALQLARGRRLLVPHRCNREWRNIHRATAAQRLFRHGQLEA